MDSSLSPERHETYARMMRLGQACYTQGARKQAHRYWRRAALIDPAQEAVWLALLHVVETEADQRVCLENILAINPQNREAHQQLAAMGVVAPLAKVTVWEVVQPVIAAILIGCLLALFILVLQTGSW